jgi:hypothetical protein
MSIDPECFIYLGNELYNNGIILSIKNRIYFLDVSIEKLFNEINDIDSIFKQIILKIYNIKLTSNSYSFSILKSNKNNYLNDQSRILNSKKKLLETKLLNIYYEYHSLNKKLNHLPNTFSLV